MDYPAVSSRVEGGCMVAGCGTGGARKKRTPTAGRIASGKKRSTTSGKKKSSTKTGGEKKKSPTKPRGGKKKSTATGGKVHRRRIKKL